ncbi:hypothetical protein DXG03_001728 [Asterophora parasitica]|uniref:Uncharacterized protein n=1 Tax=Asterophora parasitica TaxID=117018 RepID=A0A9P7GAM6_9AGAR|nr:hypothetical protein DXG03_001728 [Asterophora parasitica]
MFSTLFTIALIAAPAFADFAVNTPTVTQCKDVKISWEPTKGPYNIVAVPADAPCGDALADLGDFTTTSTTWKATLPAGSKIQLSVEDADGDEAWSGTITVQKSDDSSCLSPELVQPSGSGSASQSASASEAVKSNNLLPTNSIPVVGGGSGSTVVVTPTLTQVVGPESTDDANTPAPSAVGAAGKNPFGLGNGALSRSASTPVMVLGALAAVLAISL